MATPNVTINWCQNQAKCKWCEQPIPVGTPMVTVFFWNKGDEGKRGWNIKHYYHLRTEEEVAGGLPQCWCEQGLDWLKRNPYVSKRTGRKRIELTWEERQRRLRMLKRKASLEQRRRALEEDDVLGHAHIDTKVAELMLEIAMVGGIPKSWLEE